MSFAVWFGCAVLRPRVVAWYFYDGGKPMPQTPELTRWQFLRLHVCPDTSADVPEVEQDFACLEALRNALLPRVWGDVVHWHALATLLGVHVHVFHIPRRGTKHQEPSGGLQLMHSIPPDDAAHTPLSRASALAAPDSQAACYVLLHGDHYSILQQENTYKTPRTARKPHIQHATSTKQARPNHFDVHL